MNGLKTIELFFKMSFVDVINKLHLEQKITILELSNRCGISRDTFQRHAKKNNLVLRNQKQARLIIIEKGICSKENHWAWGLNKDNSTWAKSHSLRMKNRNPARNLDTRKKMSLTMSKTFKKNPFPQELLTMKILNKLNIEYIFQYVIDSYIIDFFLPKFNTCLEIDSTSKWGKDRTEKAKIKDIYLLKLKYKVIRVNKNHVSLDFIHDILTTHNII